MEMTTFVNNVFESTFCFLGSPVFTVCLSDLKNKAFMPKIYGQFMFLFDCLAVHERGPPVFTLLRPVSM